MSNEQQHTEIFSRNRLSHNTIIVAVVPVLAVSVVFVVAVLPHLAEIWLMVEAIAFTLTLCLMAVLVIASAYVIHRFRISSQRHDRQARFFTWEAGAAWINDAGELVNLSAIHEQAKLPAPKTIVAEMHELSPDDKEEIDRSKVLTAYFQQGKGMHAIERELNISYPKVRAWVNTALALRSKSGQVNQMEARD